MNDLTAILTKFLPIAVISGLLGIFYLLDVFSVRPGMDSATPARRVIEQSAAPSSVAPSAMEKTVQESPPPAQPTAVVNPIPPSPQPSNFPPPAPPQPMVLPPQNSSPQYRPPPGAGQPRPLASDHAPTERPTELPVHEINQDDGERIDEETRKAVEQPSRPSAGGGDG